MEKSKAQIKLNYRYKKQKSNKYKKSRKINNKMKGNQNLNKLNFVEQDSQ